MATSAGLEQRPRRGGGKKADCQLNMQVGDLHQVARTGKLCGTQVVDPNEWCLLAVIFLGVKIISIEKKKRKPNKIIALWNL